MSPEFKKYQITIPTRKGWRRLSFSMHLESNLYIGNPKKPEQH